MNVARIRALLHRIRPAVVVAPCRSAHFSPRKPQCDRRPVDQGCGCFSLDERCQRPCGVLQRYFRQWCRWRKSQRRVACRVQYLQPAICYLVARSRCQRGQEALFLLHYPLWFHTIHLCHGNLSDREGTAAGHVRTRILIAASRAADLVFRKRRRGRCPFYWRLPVQCCQHPLRPL